MAVFRAPISPGMRWAAGTGTATPAAGYLLFQYLAGGATPQATFTDAGGLTANANPLVLNANGELPSVEMWFTGGVSYRLLLTDASLAPLPGNPVWDDDNLTGENDPAFASPNTGEWITGAAATFISSAANAAGTVFSMVGDTRALFEPNRRVRIVSASGDLPGTVTRSVFAANLTTITVDMQRNAAGAYPTVGNPITALYYAIENSGASGGLAAGIPSRALELGAPRYPGDGSARTGIDMYGPIGSNLVTFLTPPDVVASAGGAGNQVVTGTVNGVAGSLTFNKTAHGRITGQAVQVATSNTLPGNVVASTTYIVFVVDANNFGLYAVPAGWQFEQPYLDPLTVPGGLTWGNPLAFSSAGVGNQTVTPGFVAPSGVGRIWAAVTGGGGGGGGSRGNTGDGGAGGNGANSTFMTLTGNFGALGNGGTNAATGGTTSAGGSASGGQLNLPGNRGEFGGFNATGANPGGAGAMSYWGGQDGGGAVKSPGSGGNGGLSTAASQGGGGGGASGGTAISWLTVTPGTWVACTVGAGGTAGTAGTGTGSNPGLAGGAGGVVIEW